MGQTESVRQHYLRSILGEIHAISGSVELGEYLHIGYFEQEIKGGKDKTCITRVLG